MKFDQSMSPASTKICQLCGVGFRGTTTPEEVHCAKCFVKTCDVPEDTDEQFKKLVSEIHGSELASTPTPPLSTTLLLPVMKDILNHKARLAKLEGNLEQCNKSTKEKNRMKREIYRLREEKKQMEILMDGIKAKLMHLALMTSVSTSSAPKVTPKPSVGRSVTDSPAKKSALKTPSPKSPAPPKVPNNTPATSTPITPVSKLCKSINFTSLSTPPTATTPIANSPPRSPTKATSQQPQQQNVEATPPESPKASPVKLTALKFEAAAKKVTSVVTFAKMPSKTKLRVPEENNNDTPVTASSEEESDEFEEMQENSNGQPSALTRSNSVRDRIKAFEEIQRRASTGSYDRKKSQQGKNNRALSSMKSINV